MEIKNLELDALDPASRAIPVDAPAAQAATPQTPTQQVIADANGIVRIKDESGRVIGIRKLSMTIRRRAIKCLSLSSVENRQYLGLVLGAAQVTEIDGMNVDAFRGDGASEVRFDALIDRLDDVGFDAINKSYAIFNPSKGEEDELKNL